MQILSSFSLAESQWQIFIKKLTQWLNDKTIIELGYRKLLDQLFWSARH